MSVSKASGNVCIGKRHSDLNLKVLILSALFAGVEAALQWLFEREGDPSLDAPLQSAQSPNRRGTDPNVTRTSELQTRSTIGIAGILKREEQIAAKNDR